MCSATDSVGMNNTTLNVQQTPFGLSTNGVLYDRFLVGEYHVASSMSGPDNTFRAQLPQLLASCGITFSPSKSSDVSFGIAGHGTAHALFFYACVTSSPFACCIARTVSPLKLISYFPMPHAPVHATACSHQRFELRSGILCQGTKPKFS